MLIAGAAIVVTLIALTSIATARFFRKKSIPSWLSIVAVAKTNAKGDIIPDSAVAMCLGGGSWGVG